MKNTLAKYLSILTVAGLLMVPLAATSALANTAANTKIVNSADLSYNDGTTGTKHATAQVTVTVTLKPAAPTITPISDKSGPYPTPLTDDYLLTNNANGPDSFILTTGINAVVNGAITGVAVGSPIWLGATVTIAGSTSNATSTFLVVPSDGVADNSINGIQKDETVVIDNNERTVRSITDNANGTSTIEVDLLPQALRDTGIVGYVVGERTTVHATVTPSAIVDPELNVTGNVTMTAKSGTDNSFSSTSGNVGNTFYPYTGSLTKYVRNDTSPNGSGTKTTLNGVDYFKDNTVTAKPGEVLEYLLLASAITATPLTQVVLTDLIPTDYVTLTTNTYGTKAFRYYPDASVTGVGSYIDYTAAPANDDAVNYNPAYSATKGEIKAWIGGAAPVYNTPGTIAGNKSVILLYQVTVKP